jgi:addiction module HigA family antidote
VNIEAPKSYTELARRKRTKREYKLARARDEFKPNYAVPPGETLRETLESLGMSQAELAQRTGRPKKTINEIIKGKTAITAETAIQLERALVAIVKLITLSLNCALKIQINCCPKEENSAVSPLFYREDPPCPPLRKGGKSGAASFNFPLC